MTKEDFITFLKLKAEEAGLHKTRWKRTYLDCEDYWTLCHPALNWMEDKMDLTEDGVVKITYSERIYDDPKSISMSYLDFVADHPNSITSF